eukprot:4022124-Ditylum_brightwellii.AAC.1
MIWAARTNIKKFNNITHPPSFTMRSSPSSNSTTDSSESSGKADLSSTSGASSTHTTTYMAVAFAALQPPKKTTLSADPNAPS